MVVVKYGGVEKRYPKGLTNRRALLILGALIAVIGLVGFFVDSSPQDHYHLDTGQNITYLAIGLLCLLVGEVWSSPWKQAFLAIVGVFWLAIAVAGFAVSGQEGHNIGIFDVQHPWENVAHLVIGLICLATVLYPRRFRDYPYATAVSD